MENIGSQRVSQGSDFEHSAEDQDDFERASQSDLSQFVESESLDISAPYTDTGIRSILQIEDVRGAKVKVTTAV